MTCWDYITVFGGYAAVIWWAFTAKWDQEENDDRL